MIAQDVDSFDLDAIKWLVQNNVSESRTLDFKRQYDLSKDRDKKDFLIDYTSFSNSSGGKIIVGVSEKEGVIDGIYGFEVPDCEGFVLTIQHLLKDCTEPRCGFGPFKWINLESGKYLLVLQVPRSPNAPHRVRIQKDVGFYKREHGTNTPMDVQQLRESFLRYDTLAKQVRQFRDSRIALIKARECPVELDVGSQVAIHILPLWDVDSQFVLDPIREIDRFRPLGGGSRIPRPCLEGVASTTHREGLSVPQRGYTLLFRSGAVEAVSNISASNGNTKIAAELVEKYLFDAAREYGVALRSLLPEMPFFAFFSLLNVKGKILIPPRTDQWTEESDPDAASSLGCLRADIHINEIELEGDLSEANIRILLRPAIEILWNAFGYERALSCDNAGRYVGTRDALREALSAR